MAPQLPFFVSSPDLVFLSDDEGEKEVINIEDSDDGGGDTHIYLSSDEEDDAVYADDGASYANSKAVSAAATSLAAASSDDYGGGNPTGASGTNNFEGAGNSNGDDDAGGYSDGDEDNHSEDGDDNTSDVSSAVASRSQRAPYNYWHHTDLCRLVEIDGRLCEDFKGASVPSSVLYKAFMKDRQPIYRGKLTSKKISEKRYQLRKKFRVFCTLEARCEYRRRHTEEDAFYACCKKAWPDIVEEARAELANK